MSGDDGGKPSEANKMAGGAPKYAAVNATNTAWVSVVTNTPASSPFVMTDTNAAAFSTRYYRVKLAP